MKTIDELGISQTPWIVANDDGLTAYVYSDNGNGDEVSQTCYGSEDARLIAAAPELYEALAALLEANEHDNMNIGAVFAIGLKDRLAAAERCIDDAMKVVEYYKGSNISFQIGNIISCYRRKKVGAKVSSEGIRRSEMDELANTITYLCMAKDCAVKAGMDYHFLPEIDHLIATAEANVEEEK